MHSVGSMASASPMASHGRTQAAGSCRPVNSISSAQRPTACSPWRPQSARVASTSAHASHGDMPSSSHRLSSADLGFLSEAAQLADSSAGISQPHPNAACILVGPDGRPLTSAFQLAQGTTSSEVQAVATAGAAARGSTAYLNLETGDCHGESAAVKALVQGGVGRVVVGMRHPLGHMRGRSIKALRDAGIRVDVLGELPVLSDGAEEKAALEACVRVNEALLHRAVLRRPMSILKYAMTLDGKIATQAGHSAWVTSPPARSLVFEQRARSDAVIVGGNTVRRDNPRLTTRREDGHRPVRVVMSRTLDLPEDAGLWDVTVAPTIVMTQRGARQRFQSMLRARGVEVVEFDFLTPENVAEYCYERGFLQCFWECGGVLSAPCISGGVIHKVMAFVAPKIIGGERAPSPVGELGFVEMTQAVQLEDVRWRQVGPDLMIVGFLPTSNGPLALEASLSAGSGPAGSIGASGAAAGAAVPSPSSSEQQQAQATAAGAAAAAASAPPPAAAAASLQPSASSSSPRDASPPSSSASISSTARPPAIATRARGTIAPVRKVATFYKAWDQWGSLGNFSPHPVSLPLYGSDSAKGAEAREWASVEHFYQACKFSQTTEEGRSITEQVAAMPSPEEAARLGRLTERTRPDLVRPDWKTAKLEVMLNALRAKFETHEGPRAMLQSSEGLELVESSPHDFFWGQGYDGSGRNQLGRLLMQVRAEIGAAASAPSAAQ